MGQMDLPIGSLFVVCILVLIGVHTVHLIRRGRWMVLDPLYAFWGGVVVVYVIQPIQYGDMFVSWHRPGVYAWTLGWSLLAFACVVLGYESKWGIQWGKKVPTIPARLIPARTINVVGLLFGIGLF
ncbi:MAG TPA: hypothetical protein VGY77_10805, partial [Gemmataceae bacterium]|nr:hypothetical protein [Gemmataceae bacterium]